MKSMILRGGSCTVEIHPLRRVALSLRKKIIENCPAGSASNTKYVIFAGSRNEQPDTGHRPVLTYQDPSGAFLVSHSPITLCARGEVSRLAADSIYFIPPDHSAIQRRKLYAAAAAIVFLGITLWASYSLWNKGNADNPLSDPKIAQLFEEGYRGLNELPDQYLSLVPEIKDEKFFASRDAMEGSGAFQEMDKYIGTLLVKLLMKGVYDTKLFYFYNDIIESDLYQSQTRKQALLNMLGTAMHHNLLEIASLYKDHDQETIKEETNRYIFMNKEVFDKAGIYPDRNFE